MRCLKMFELKNIMAITNKMEIADFVCYHERADMYLLTIFQSDILFSYNGKNYFSCPKNSMVIYTPDALQTYKGNDTFFLNSFLGFTCEPEFFNNYKLPLNTIFTIEPEELSETIKIIDAISFTLNTDYFHDQKHVIPDTINKLFTHLEKAYETAKNAVPKKTILYNAREDLRNRPLETPINVLAKKLGYNLSYFCEIYKKQFGITPGQEKKKQIIKLIKNYLETTNYPLEKIAELCKIANVPLMIRMFKQSEKMTPHQYRLKNNQNYQENENND